MNLSDQIRELAGKATKGKFRPHDHHGMARVGGKPEEWLGYAWVGRLTNSSTDDGAFDAPLLSTDRRKDGSPSYRESGQYDVALVCLLLNHTEEILAALSLQERMESPGCVEVVAQAIYEHEPFEGQETDLDFRPVGPVYQIPWSAIVEDQVAHDDFREKAQAAIAAMKGQKP